MFFNQRYDFDGKAILKLNGLQLKMKSLVEEKVKEGIYKFEALQCPVCDGSDFTSLAKKDRYGLYMPVVICKDCGLIQTNPRMNQKAYNEFYNDEYRKLYGGKENPTDKFFYDQYYKGLKIYEYLLNNGLYKSLEDMFVLEVGCGAGGILHYFRGKGCRVKGIDLERSYIEFGANRYKLNLSVGTIDTIVLDEPPDLIIYSHVLEHILSPNDELQKVHKILSNKGQLYIEVPGVKNLDHNYKMDFLRSLQNAHVYYFSQISLNNLLIRNGFEQFKSNEIVNGVFIKLKEKKISRGFENDYLAVLEYLHNAEKYRKLYLISPNNILNFIRSTFIYFLKGIGLFDLFRNQYHKIRKRKN